MTSKNLKNEDSELLTPNTTGDTIASLVESKLGEFVKYADMTSSYWTERFITARRLW